MDETLMEAAKSIKQRFGAELQETNDGISLMLHHTRIVEALQALRDDFHFDMLVDVTAVDYYPQEEPRFHLVYQLASMKDNSRLQVRVPLSGNKPHANTVENVYPGANWYERELWDMFGIHIDGHSDLRRILMPYDWQGHPLRKDYPLGYEEVQFTFNFSEISLRKPHGKE
jgi:NADH-quinone oxidoreductase subunit C